LLVTATSTDEEKRFGSLIFYLDVRLRKKYVMPRYKDVLQIQVQIYAALILPTNTMNLLWESHYWRLHHRKEVTSRLFHEMYCVLTEPQNQYARA